MTCTRMKTAVYGIDGELAARLVALAEVLLGEGWTSVVMQRGPGADSPRPQRVILRDVSARLAWEPAYATPPYPSGMPTGLEDSSPVPSSTRSRFRMSLAWSTGTTGSGPVKSMALARKWPRRDTDLYRRVEISGDVSDGLDAILGRHSHVLAVRVSAIYYSNPDARWPKLR